MTNIRNEDSEDVEAQAGLGLFNKRTWLAWSLKNLIWESTVRSEVAEGKVRGGRDRMRGACPSGPCPTPPFPCSAPHGRGHESDNYISRLPCQPLPVRLCQWGEVERGFGRKKRKMVAFLLVFWLHLETAQSWHPQPWSREHLLRWDFEGDRLSNKRLLHIVLINSWNYAQDTNRHIQINNRRKLNSHHQPAHMHFILWCLVHPVWETFPERYHKMKKIRTPVDWK